MCPECGKPVTAKDYPDPFDHEYRHFECLSEREQAKVKAARPGLVAYNFATHGRIHP